MIFFSLVFLFFPVSAPFASLEALKRAPVKVRRLWKGVRALDPVQADGEVEYRFPLDMNLRSINVRADVEGIAALRGPTNVAVLIGDEWIYLDISEEVVIDPPMNEVSISIFGFSRIDKQIVTVRSSIEGPTLRVFTNHFEMTSDRNRPGYFAFLSPDTVRVKESEQNSGVWVLRGPCHAFVYEDGSEVGKPLGQPYPFEGRVLIKTFHPETGEPGHVFTVEAGAKRVADWQGFAVWTAVIGASFLGLGTVCLLGPKVSFRNAKIAASLAVIFILVSIIARLIFFFQQDSDKSKAFQTS